MFLNHQTQRTFNNNSVDESIFSWAEAFLIDRKARGCATGTIDFYLFKLKLFFEFCEIQNIKSISQITPQIIRQYLLYLEDKHHNSGGRHAAFRTLRAFLLWYEEEVEPENWTNPIRKVKAPRVPDEPLEPVEFRTVLLMLQTCGQNSFGDLRDKAIILFLLDTGVRAGEFLAINLDDINQARGEILIRHGKGKKPRYAYIGKNTKRVLRKYLKQRKDSNHALWVTQPRYESDRLSYDGLRSIMVRRSKQAGVEPPSLHDFRRAFALSMLRSGTDIFTLAKLMGHTGIHVLQRYLKQTHQDTEVAHRKASPVDFGLIRYT